MPLISGLLRLMPALSKVTLPSRLRCSIASPSRRLLLLKASRRPASLNGELTLVGVDLKTATLGAGGFATVGFEYSVREVLALAETS